MHIAIEGFDGSGKTSQAQTIAKILGCSFIPKSFHEMLDVSGKYDNFFTVEQYTNGDVNGVYGLRGEFFLRKLRGQDVVTDRFYVSNYWSRADSYSIKHYENIAKYWGRPELTILLYADSENLYRRMFLRNPNDKDFDKLKHSENAYLLMRTFIKQMELHAIEIDTSNLSFDTVTKHIIDAIATVRNNCLNKNISTTLLTERHDNFSIINNAIIVHPGAVKLCNNSFAGMDKIKTIEIPSTVEYIGFGAFADCLSLNSIIFESNNMTKIQSASFVGCKNLTEIKLPRGNVYNVLRGYLKDSENNIVLKIKCSSELSFSVPDCEYIYPWAFESKLNVKTLNCSSRRIGSYVFENCSIDEIILAKTVEDIGEKSFYGCGAKTVVMHSKCAPSMWGNSFDERTDFLVPVDGWENYVNDKSMRRIRCVIGKKPESMLCGDVCALYSESHIIPSVTSEHMFWVSDIGNYFLSTGKSCSIIYHGSRLMADYYSDTLDDELRDRLQSFVKHGGCFVHRKQSVELLMELSRRYERVILLLDSAKLFRNESLLGNHHFVILESLNNTYSIIINPGKNNIYRERIATSELFDMIGSDGQWVILVGERE